MNTTNSGEELKPCPLCGSAAHFFHIDDIDSKEFGGHGICCDTYSCAQVGLMFACGDDPKPALAEIWNRRAAASAQTIGEDAAKGAMGEATLVHPPNDMQIAFEHADTRTAEKVVQAAHKQDDAIARSKRILALVDAYLDQPSRMTRNNLRGALMDEFIDATRAKDSK